MLLIIYSNANILYKQGLLFIKLKLITNKAIVNAKLDFYNKACLESID